MVLPISKIRKRLIIKQKIEKKCVDKLSFLYFSQLKQNGKEYEKCIKQLMR